MFWRKQLVLLAIMAPALRAQSQLTPGSDGKYGISSMTTYLTTVKSVAEDLLYDVYTKEALMVGSQDMSNGDSTSLTANLQILISDQDAKIYSLYNDLKARTNSFINCLESDLISSNKLILKDRQEFYKNTIYTIDTMLTNLNNYKRTNFDVIYRNFVKRVKAGKEASGASTPFTWSSLIPDPLSFITEVVSIFQAKRDFRAQQIQSICTILESIKLGTISEVTSGSAGDAASSSKSGAAKDASSGSKKKKKGQ